MFFNQSNKLKSVKWCSNVNEPLSIELPFYEKGVETCVIGKYNHSGLQPILQI